MTIFPDNWIDVIQLPLALIALVLALIAWRVDHRDKKWSAARNRLLAWNTEVMEVTEKLLASQSPLDDLKRKANYRAGLRLYAERQLPADIETVFRDPVYRFPGKLDYPSRVMSSVLWNLSSLSPSIYGSNNSVQIQTDGAALAVLKELHERSGVFDRFTRERKEQSKSRTAWLVVRNFRKVRHARKAGFNDLGVELIRGSFGLGG